MLTQTVRERIIAAIARHKTIIFDETIVAELVAKVEAAPANNKLAYAYVVGRNWAITQYRKRQAAIRLQARRTAELLELERKKQEEADLQAAREEFVGVADRILERATLMGQSREGVLRRLAVVWLAVFDGLTALQMQRKFSDVKLDNLYQLCHRGKELAMPFASERLKRVLAKRMRS